MTRTHIVTQLLRHGAMTRPDMLDCLGWTERQMDGALQSCLKDRRVVRVGKARTEANGLRVYKLYKAVG
jgi:hypothetical protein